MICSTTFSGMTRHAVQDIVALMLNDETQHHGSNGCREFHRTYSYIGSDKSYVSKKIVSEQELLFLLFCGLGVLLSV
jgi:hypothetical protein